MSERKKSIRPVCPDIFRALRSIKFTVVLIAYMAVTCALSTFVQQGLHEAEYAAVYPRAIAAFIVATGFNHFFSSLWFLAPAFLFFINLTACTIYRFGCQLRKTTGRNFGPDILHGGLILLIAASLLTVFFRQEGLVRLSAGDSIKLPGGAYMTLDKFEHLQYDNGRPLDWISHVSVMKEGEQPESYQIRVNHPVKLGGITFYQYSYATIGDTHYTVLQAVNDPAYGFVFASFIICVIGLCITMWIKLRKKIRKEQ